LVALLLNDPLVSNDVGRSCNGCLAVVMVVEVYLSSASSSSYAS